MTTAIERLIRECPEGEWLPEGYTLNESRTIITAPSGHHAFGVAVAPECFRLAVQGRLAELLAERGTFVQPERRGEWSAVTISRSVDSGRDEIGWWTLSCPTCLDAQADAWIAVGRG